MKGQQSAQGRRAAFLLTLDEDRHSHRRLAVVGAKSREVRCDAGFVVGSTAAVKPAVALSRHKRWRIPLPSITFGLNVVMGVQQNCRSTRWRGMMGDHRGRTALAHDLDFGEPGVT